MILQNVNRELIDLNIAKIVYLLNETKTVVSISDLEELLSSTTLSIENITNSKIIEEIISTRILNSKPIKTPIDDWLKVPFIIDKNEKPVSAVNSWIRHISERGSPKTWRTYSYALLDFLQFLEANDLTWQDTNDEILLSYRRVQETSESLHKNKSNGQNSLSKNTIQARILFVGWFFDYAEEYGYIDKNPLAMETLIYNVPVHSNFLAHIYSTREKKQPSVAYSKGKPKSPIKSLPHETIWDWINAIPTKRDKLIAKIMYQTGMRREEIVLLKINDIPNKDYKKENSLDGVLFSIEGKGSKRRNIVISDNLYLQLQRWINTHRKKILERTGIRFDHNYLWITLNHGTPLLVSAINSFFRKHSQKHGVYITPHMLRHSFAMQKRHQLYETGAKNPEKTLQQILGHSSIVTTMTTYGHISPEDLSTEALENLNFITSLTEDEIDEDDYI